MPVVFYPRHGDRDSPPKTLIRGGGPGAEPCSLTPEGVRQAMKLGDMLSNFKVDLLVTSPLTRAYYTADLIKYRYYKNTGRTLTIVPEPLLAERLSDKLDNGPIPNNMSVPDFLRDQARRGYPDIEPFDAMKRRVSRFLSELYPERRATKVVVAVTHKDVIHAAVSLATGMSELDPELDPGVPQGSLTAISYTPKVRLHTDQQVVRLFGATELTPLSINSLKSIIRRAA